MENRLWPDNQYLNLNDISPNKSIDFYFTSVLDKLIETYKSLLEHTASKGYFLIYYREDSNHEPTINILIDNLLDDSIDDLVFTVALSRNIEANEEDDERRLMITYSQEKDINTGHYMAESGILVKCNNISFSRIATGGNLTVYGNKKSESFNPEELFNIFKEKRLHKVEKKESKKTICNEWANILKYAKDFTDLEDNLERIALVSKTTLNYTKFESVFQNVDSDVRYKFFVDSIGKQGYEKGIGIDINDTFGTLKRPIGGKISEIDKNENSIVVSFPNQISVEKIPTSGTISLTYTNVQSRVRNNVISSMRNLEKGEYLNDIFANGGKCLEFENIDLSALEEKWKRKQQEVDRIKSLPKEEQKNFKIDYPPTDSQQIAIKNGIKAKDFYLVWGPPGTGKTTVILEWVNYFASQGKKVLISSQNNKAVDNVLERLPEEIRENSIRIGNEDKIQENNREVWYQQKVSSLSNLLEKNVEKNKVLFDEKITGIKDKHKKLKEYQNEFEKLFSNYNSDILNKIIGDFNYFLKMAKETYLKYINVSMEIEYIENKIPKLPFLKIFFKSKYRDKYYTQKALVNSYNKYIDAILDIDKEMIVNDLEEFIKTHEFVDKNVESFYVSRMTDIGFIVRVKDYLNNSIKECEKVIEELEVLIQGNKEWEEQIKKRNDAITSEIILKSTRVVGATCIGISTRRIFQNIDFDISIIDESGQIQLHNALVPMARSNKTIMLGDHKQIPPSPKEEILSVIKELGIPLEQKLYETSFFDYLYTDLIDEKNKTILDTQFRMPGEIADLLSIYFYESKYKSAEFKRGLPPLVDFLEKPFCLIDTLDYGKMRFENSKEEGGGRVNKLECAIIIDLVEYLLDNNKVEKNEIGIIVPYKDQLRYIRKSLNERFKNKYQASEIKDMVGTLDSFQGQERDLIIYGITRSNKRPPDKQRIGFLSELRRFNVALSRPKKQVVIVGDFEFLKECENEGNVKIDDDINDDQYTYKPSTEKDFGEFVKAMYKDVVEDKKGSFIKSKDLYRRIGKGGPKFEQKKQK